MANINFKTLVDLGACRSGLSDFISWFPEGEATWDAVVDRCVNGHCDHAERISRLNDLWWLVSRVPNDIAQLSWYARLGFNNMGDSSAAEHLCTHCPADVKDSTWDNRLGRCVDDIQLARLAQRCVGGVEGATWESRLSFQPDGFGEAATSGMARVGIYCPANVEGATWEARKSVQHSGWYRIKLGIHCPAGVEGATWKARLALMRNNTNRTTLAFNCPAGVEGATWNARLKWVKPDNLVHFAFYCPPGVEGSTLEARLSLVKDKADRIELVSRCSFGIEGATYENLAKVWRDSADIDEPCDLIFHKYYDKFNKGE